MFKDEGCKFVPYIDTRGNWTVGMGHKVLPAEHDLVFPSITEAQCHAFFTADWAQAVTLSSKLAYYVHLNPARQRLQACLMFNMGPEKWSGFHDTQRYMTIGVYVSAGNALLQSAWAHEVQPERRDAYVRIMTTGVWE